MEGTTMPAQSFRECKTSSLCLGYQWAQGFRSQDSLVLGLGTRPKDQPDWVRRGKVSDSLQPLKPASWYKMRCLVTRVPPQSQLSVVNGR